MCTITIKKSNNLTVRIDDKITRQSKADALCKKLVPNKEYVLSWFIIAEPTTKYSLEIVSPPGMLWKTLTNEAWNSSKLKIDKELRGKKDMGFIFIKCPENSE